MVAKFKSNSGGVALGQLVQLYPHYPDEVELNDQSFVRVGFVTDEFDPSLTPPKFNAFLTKYTAAAASSYTLSSGCEAAAAGGTTIVPIRKQNFLRTSDDFESVEIINTPHGDTVSARPLLLALGNSIWLSIMIWNNSGLSTIARSTDDGFTFEPLDLTVFGLNPNFTDASHNGAGTVMIMRSGTAFISTDYGLTFTQGGYALNGSEDQWGSVYWVGGTQWIARNRPNEFWKTNNNGSSWTQLTSMPSASILATGAPGNIRKSSIQHDAASGLTWTFSSNQAWSSSNGGASWTLMFSMPIGSTSPVNFGNGLWLKYLSTSSIAISEDDGGAWETTTGVLGLLAGNFFKSAAGSIFLVASSTGKILKPITAFGVAALTSPDANSYYVRCK